MLDQSFSYYNFNKIFLQDNRKGNFDRKFLNEKYFAKHDEFKKILKEKEFEKSLKGSLTKEELNGFAERLETINKEKEEIRLAIFQELAKKVSEKKFQFNLEYNDKKEVFTIKKDDSASYYSIKQLQYNIHNTFKVKQANRNRIIKQLYQLISDGYPKIVIRTDIKGFYESISQDKLFPKIENNTLLSPFSKKLIRKLFYEFENKKDTSTIPKNKGIPRGVSISAYLAELYMRDIDNKIKALDDLIYYARYVDDMVMIFTPKTPSTEQNYLDFIKKIVNKDGLDLKDGSDGEETKTFVIKLFNSGIYNEEFNFLGYKFIISRNETRVSGGKLKVDFNTKIEISENKINKYKKRLFKTVESYNRDSYFNEKNARKLLFERLKFLTGNFHLQNAKRNIKSGIYYSNAILMLNKNMESIDSLNLLNKELCKAVRLISPPPKIKIRKGYLIKHIISRFNFKDGFLNKEKCFYSFKLSKKEESYFFKKYNRAVSKFEIIKSIWKDE